MATGQTGSVVDAGDAWFAPGIAATGTVAGVFRQAAYLRFGPRLLALCAPEVDPGPLHLRLDRLPALAVGLGVTLSDGRLVVGSLGLELDEEHRWSPEPVDAGALRAATPPGQPDAGRRAADAGLAVDLVVEAGRMVGRGDLGAVAHLVGGRGPGLTPAGDDLLAGVLVADAVLRPDDGRPRRRAAAGVQTTAVAAAFLRWAAVGRCIRPVHDVLAARAGHRGAAEATARRRLHRLGASSGPALLLGLDLALFAEAQR